MKSRHLKLLIAFISPPILGSFILVGYDVLLRINEGRFGTGDLLEQLETMPITIFFAFLLVGLQSMIYAILMEFLITPYVPKTCWFIVSSCLLGSCSGLTLLFLLPAEAAPQIIFTGATVGIIVGYWLLKIDPRSEKNT
jgi:hypothetical protein